MTAHRHSGAPMPDSVDLGFNGLKARPGAHICGIYAGERQRDEIVLPFLETGLRAGRQVHVHRRFHRAGGDPGQARSLTWIPVTEPT